MCEFTNFEIVVAKNFFQPSEPLLFGSSNASILKSPSNISILLPTRYIRQSINPVNGEFDDLYINATEVGLFLNCCFFRSGLESYTSNNTRQREAT